MVKRVYPKWAKKSWVVYRVGSRETCNPPPTGTDEDFLVFADFYDAVVELESLGFTLSNDNYEADENVFNSLRKGDINALVTSNVKFFKRFLEATKIAKEKNLMDKQDRIDLFQKILYDEEGLLF